MDKPSRTPQSITTGLLVDHDDMLSDLVDLFESEWPDWYNPRGASARADLSERLERNRLPLGIVAFAEGDLSGTCALTASSGGLTERSPWLGGFLVRPALRGQGIGLALIARAEDEARRLGYSRLHALSAEAGAVFERAGWRLLERVEMHGVFHSIYVVAL